MNLQEIKRRVKQNKILNPVVTVLGVLCIIIGLLGLILPVIPGVVFLVIGIIMLGEEFFISRWIIRKLPKSARDKLKNKKDSSKID